MGNSNGVVVVIIFFHFDTSLLLTNIWSYAEIYFIPRNKYEKKKQKSSLFSINFISKQETRNIY